MIPADKRVLRQFSKKLSSPKTYLRELPSGDFGVFRKGQKSPKAQTRIAASHIIAWQKADLLDGVVDLALSATGRAFLNRANGDFLAQHKLLTPSADTIPQTAHTTPLQWLRARHGLSKFSLLDIEFEAGERLSDDYGHAVWVPRQTMDWHRPIFVDGLRHMGEPEPSLRALDARRRLKDATDYTGPGLSEVAVAICCAEVGLEACEQGLALPQRSGKIMLKMALMRLSVHYGYQTDDAAAASFRIR